MSFFALFFSTGRESSGGVSRLPVFLSTFVLLLFSGEKNVPLHFITFQMAIYHNTDIVLTHSGSIATVGMFDGVHRGHRHLIDRLLKEAKARRLHPIVVTFERHPRLVLGRSSDTFAPLCDAEQRFSLIQSQGELDVTMARSGWLPSVDANIGTHFNAQSRRWHVTPSASAGISATWNIFDSGVTRAEVEAAKVEVEQLKLALDADIDLANEDVVTAYKNLQTALVRLSTTQKISDIAEEQRYIATERYNAGEGILLEVLDAELALSTAKKNNVSARYDVMRYSFDLAHATGNTLRAIRN